MSIYNSRLNCCFIHVPRCAGSSIAEIIEGQGHKDIIYFKRFLIGQSDLNFEDIFKFAFVRNPYDRFISGYHWTKSKIDINDYASQLAEKYETWKDNSLEELMFRPQWKYLCNQYKHIQVDFVGRFENLKDDWHTISKKLGIEEKLPHLNKSKSGKLNSRGKSIIKELYKDDFKVFGY